MIVYLAIFLQAAVIGLLAYKIKKEKEESKVLVQAAGEIGAQHVNLINEQQNIKNAAGVLVTAYEDLVEKFNKLQDNYNTVEYSSIAQTKLIEEQYDMIETYHDKVTSLEEKLAKSERLRIN